MLNNSQEFYDADIRVDLLKVKQKLLDGYPIGSTERNMLIREFKLLALQTLTNTLNELPVETVNQQLNTSLKRILAHVLFLVLGGSATVMLSWALFSLVSVILLRSPSVMYGCLALVLAVLLSSNLYFFFFHAKNLLAQIRLNYRLRVNYQSLREQWLSLVRELKGLEKGDTRGA